MFYLLYLHYADVAQDYPLLNLVRTRPSAWRWPWRPP